MRPRRRRRAGLAAGGIGRDRRQAEPRAAAPRAHPRAARRDAEHGRRARPRGRARPPRRRLARHRDGGRGRAPDAAAERGGLDVHAAVRRPAAARMAGVLAGVHRALPARARPLPARRAHALLPARRRSRGRDPPRLARPRRGPDHAGVALAAAKASTARCSGGSCATPASRSSCSAVDQRGPAPRSCTRARR